MDGWISLPGDLYAKPVDFKMIFLIRPTATAYEVVKAGVEGEELLGGGPTPAAAAKLVVKQFSRELSRAGRQAYRQSRRERRAAPPRGVAVAAPNPLLPISPGGNFRIPSDPWPEFAGSAVVVEPAMVMGVDPVSLRDRILFGDPQRAQSVRQRSDELQAEAAQARDRQRAAVRASRMTTVGCGPGCPDCQATEVAVGADIDSVDPF